MTSPFNWQGTPSIMMKDKHMRAEKDGLTRALRQTAIHEQRAKEGYPITALPPNALTVNPRLHRHRPSPPEMMVQRKDDNA